MRVGRRIGLALVAVAVVLPTGIGAQSAEVGVELWHGVYRPDYVERRTYADNLRSDGTSTSLERLDSDRPGFADNTSLPVFARIFQPIVPDTLDFMLGFEYVSWSQAGINSPFAITRDTFDGTTAALGMGDRRFNENELSWSQQELGVRITLLDRVEILPRFGFRNAEQHYEYREELLAEGNTNGAAYQTIIRMVESSFDANWRNTFWALGLRFYLLKDLSLYIDYARYLKRTTGITQQEAQYDLGTVSQIQIDFFEADYSVRGHRWTVAGEYRIGPGRLSLAYKRDILKTSYDNYKRVFRIANSPFGNEFSFDQSGSISNYYAYRTEEIFPIGTIALGYTFANDFSR